MVKMRFIWLVSACLLGVSLVACQDKFQQVDDALSKPKPGEGTSLEKNYVPFFESDVLISEEDELRSFEIEFDRSASDDKAKLSYPRLKFVEGQEIEVDVILRREKGGKVNFIHNRGKAQFISVAPKGLSGKVRFWLKKEDPKKNKSLFTFESDETWHAMFILDAEADITATQSGQEIALFGERPSDRNSLNDNSLDRDVVLFVGNNQTAGTGAAEARRVAPDAKWPGFNGYSYSSGPQEIPLISDWKRLEIKTGATSADSEVITDRPNVLVRLAQNTTFRIKPQGLLLNYQITANVYEGIDMRRAEVVSNTLDFQGQYKLDTESLKAAFEKSNGGNGYGIPTWEPIKSKLKEAQRLKMYKASVADYNFGYPWDMPMVSDRFAITQSGGIEMAETMAEADVAMALFEASQPTVLYGTKLSGMKIGLTTPRPTLEDKPPGNYSDVVYHVQWAMPKKQTPQKPFTYLWIDAHSAHSEQEYFPATVWTLKPSERPDMYLQFLKQSSFRTQPMVVVHQTNADFKNQVGKTPRLYATISADLMITELVYRKEGSRNFSVVELQNPSRLPINLDDYALVRLVSDGTKMQYRTSGGTGTDDLNTAQLYYLSSLDKSKMVRGYTDKDGLVHVEGEGTSQQEANYTWSFTGDFRRPFNQFLVDNKKRLEAGQIVLLGAAGYTQVDATTQSWWAQFFPDVPRKNVWYEAEKRFRYFIGCNTEVLNINSQNNGGVRDGLALVKIIDGRRKVIDTTAPIGISNLGFSGTFNDYRSELVKTNSVDYYTQNRKDGVIFPFIPPYRTVKVTSDWSDDWVVTINPASHTATDNSLPINKQTLGYRWLASLDGAMLTGGKRLKLDRGSNFTKKRTPLGRPDLYKNSRPVHR